MRRGAVHTRKIAEASMMAPVMSTIDHAIPAGSLTPPAAVKVWDPFVRGISEGVRLRAEGSTR
jgi:hypothetical protein